MIHHAYPHHLSEEILRHWGTASERETSEGHKQLPDRDMLDGLISTCYQVSMMSEELRPPRLRIVLCDPSEFPPDLGPPYGFLRIVFEEPRAFHEYELRKLSPASEFESSLIGIRHDPEGLQIWGLINSGTRWTQIFQGGSKAVIPMPDALVLDITGPGSIRAYRGSRVLAQLSAGRIIISSTNVMHSRWIAKRSETFEKEIMEMHFSSRSEGKKSWATVNESLVARLYQQVIKRIISGIRNMKHGGTIILLPPGLMQRFTSPNPFLFISYIFRDEKPVRRLHWLAISILNELAQHYGSCVEPGNAVGWSEYVAANNKTLLELDEALFECARFIANLAMVDGAVVLTRGLDLVGFGGVVKGAFSKEDVIARAMDAEGEQRVFERAEGVGTRHLAAYHLCKEIPEATAVVISQDGNTRLVAWMNDFVTYWDFLPMTVEDTRLLSAR